MKKIVFITGTRADYGKIKSVIKMLDNSNTFDVYIYVTGMHLLEKYGSTLKFKKTDLTIYFCRNELTIHCLWMKF